ncbi:hypothetical protein KM043_009302 [Ampulex compressa]|nr:hypothetical protein KM043_009302 [Ampulex compressa]
MKRCHFSMVASPLGKEDDKLVFSLPPRAASSSSVGSALKESPCSSHEGISLLDPAKEYPFFRFQYPLVIFVVDWRRGNSSFDSIRVCRLFWDIERFLWNDYAWMQFRRRLI